MNYPPLVHYSDETKYREHYERVYCHGTIETFDGIKVRFRKNQFDHCFYESSRRNRNKDRFSHKRVERLDWIHIALKDPHSERYVGWDNRRKCYDNSRRVTVVQEHYVVVIRLTGKKEAEFVTAFFAETVGERGRPSTIEKIRKSRKWA